MVLLSFIFIVIAVVLIMKYMPSSSPIGSYQAVRVYVQGPDIDYTKKSLLVLWKDKITINGIQTIPIERISYASFFKGKHRTYYSWNKRTDYRLNIRFIDVNGKHSSLFCHTGVNEHLTGDQLERLGNEINRLTGYTPPQPPTLPYEL